MGRYALAKNIHGTYRQIWLDVEPSSILENRFPKELPSGYASQASQPPVTEDSPVTVGASGMY
jgi:hypothetical protein